MSWGSYPITHDNGAGQRLTILGRVVERGREWVEVENEIAPGRGPAMHVHPAQDEEVTVLAGTLGYEFSDGASGLARTGETLAFPRGRAHRFWNAGSDTLRCRGRISPPLRFEYFIGALYRSFAEHGGKRPGLFDMAFLLKEFAPEGTMVGIPAPVRYVVLPVVRAVGRMTGRYARYADVPRAD